jgi:hypothetical protein
MSDLFRQRQGNTMRRAVRSLRRGGWLAPTRLIAAVAAVVLVATACSSSGAPAPRGGGRSAPNLITEDEIAKASVQNALEAVQKLRPAMLKRPTVASANAQSKGELVIYVDNTRFGSGAVENLRQIPASTIAAVRYFSASESQMKWGSNHPGGVIEVLTKR